MANAVSGRCDDRRQDVDRWIASINVIGLRSWTFAPVWMIARGVPWPRSNMPLRAIFAAIVGLGPVCAPKKRSHRATVERHFRPIDLVG